MISKYRSILFVALLLGAMNFAHSQNVHEIVAKYTSALKKSADDDSIKTMELKGDFIMQKLKFPATMYSKSPYHLRIEMHFQTQTFLFVSNDTIKWEYDPLRDENKISRVDKTERDNENNSNTSFDFIKKDLLDYKQLGHKVKLERKEKMDSLEVFVLKLSKDDPQKSVTTIYMNTKNHLIYKIVDENGYRYFADYITVDNFVFPRFIIESKPDQLLEAHFQHISINPELSDSLFLIPQEILDNHKIYNNDIDRALAKADSLYESGEYAKATAQYSVVIGMDDKNFRAYNARGLSKIALNKYYEAIVDFNSALEIDSTGANAINNRGLAKFYLKDLNGAVEDYTQAIGLDTTLLITIKNRALAYLQLGQYDLAADGYAQVIQAAPEDGESHYKLGVALAQIKKYEEALLAYEQALANQYTSAVVYNHKGVTEYSLEKFEGAKKSFEMAMEAAPDNLQYLENYARTLYELEDYKGAAMHFEKYILNKDDNPEMHNFLGLCSFNQEDYLGAVQYFTKAIEYNGKSAIYYDNRAAAKEKLEDYVGTINDYSTSIKIYPNDPAVFYKRGLIKILTSKKIEGCLDLATANEMEYEPAKEAIMKNCN